MNRTRTALALLAAVFALSLMPLVAAGDINISINEAGKIVSFYDEYYIYQINGTVTVTNPSNSSLFNIEVPLYLSTLDIRTNYTKQGNYLTPDELFIYALEPNASETFPYRLVGISTEDLSTDGQAVLANAIEAMDPRIYSNLFGTLQKAQMEKSSITGRDARLISVEIRNPTDFVYNVDKVEVIKTGSMDPSEQIKKWVFTDQKPKLDPYENWAFDFIDENATEGQIYWLTTDIYIDSISIEQDSNISRYDQNDLFEVISNATLNQSENATLPLLSDRVYLRKMVSSSLVVPGDVINVTVLVNNLEPKEVDLMVHDSFPQGFEAISVEGGSVAGNNVTWNLTLSSGAAKRLRYSLRYDDEDSLGLDYFKPAYLVYDGNTVYSQSTPFVRKYVPKKRLFVQKNVKFLSDDNVEVTLSLKNLGESSLHNLMLKEYLLSTAEFREISQQPLQRGLWKIDRLNQSGTWEVSYVTDKMSLLNNMPEVFGVEKGSVLQTIILSNLITSQFSVLSTNLIEIIGVVVLGIILILYFIPPSYFSRKRRHQNKDLHLISRELDDLRRKTDHQHQSAAGMQKSSPALRPDQGSKVQRPSAMQDPRRVARHDALADAADKIEGVKKDLSGKDEEKK